MSFIFSKLLIFALQPIIWIFVTLVFAFFTKNQQRRKNLFIFGIILLFVFSNRFLVGKVYNIYEATYPPKKQYDIGILLGGFSKSTKGGQLAANERGDRLIQTIYLYKTGVIKKILISGGSGKLIGSESIEADLTSTYLHNIGIPDSAVLIENRSKNTIENAKYSVEIANRNGQNASVLVITSAWHIPRSRMIFNKAFNRELDYYPTDFIGKDSYDISDFYMPDAGTLSYWQYILKEWVGLVVDKFRS
ncbi:YdcF family protein [Pedobacter agri]|uniref:YdcF family protein n=1 Tax=Pedobacter agri TaxID=454586 RepID=A0A9X3I9P4_9SPHI|nr:YdcF family protein [Pedobacter agri]MCX3266051.1 YdcF family protein [Pedobacter agri]